MLQVGVMIKHIENKHLQNLLIFRVSIIWEGTKKFGGHCPECLPMATGLRGAPRLDGARARKKFGASMFKHKVFRKPMCCVEKS